MGVSQVANMAVFRDEADVVAVDPHNSSFPPPLLYAYIRRGGFCRVPLEWRKKAVGCVCSSFSLSFNLFFLHRGQSRCCLDAASRPRHLFDVVHMWIQAQAFPPFIKAGLPLELPHAYGRRGSKSVYVRFLCRAPLYVVSAVCEKLIA